MAAYSFAFDDESLCLHVLQILPYGYQYENHEEASYICGFAKLVYEEAGV